jgi:hypothetical protein
MAHTTTRITPSDGPESVSTKTSESPQHLAVKRCILDVHEANSAAAKRDDSIGAMLKSMASDLEEMRAKGVPNSDPGLQLLAHVTASTTASLAAYSTEQAGALTTGQAAALSAGDPSQRQVRVGDVFHISGMKPRSDTGKFDANSKQQGK